MPVPAAAESARAPADPAPTIPALDGLRGFACLLVLLAHASWKGWFFDVRGAGQLGVMLFFALSGFLMAHHYLPGRAAPSYWLAFLTRRVLRVYPTFFVVTFLLWVAQRAGIPFAAGFTRERLLAHWALLRGDAIFWTVIVEMKFYAFFPVLAVTALRLPARVVPPALVVFWALLLVLVPAAPPDRLTLWPYLSFFVGGVAMASATRASALAGGRERLWSWIGLGCFLVLAIWIPHPYSLARRYDVDPWLYPWGFAPLMALTVASVAQAGGALRWLFANPVARFVGRISYSLYLVNSNVFSWLRPYVTAGPVGGFAIGVTAAVLVAWILYVVVERPFSALGKRWSARWLAPVQRAP